MYVQLQKSLLIFNRKNLGRVAWLCAELVFVGAMLVRAPFWRIRSMLCRGPELDLQARCAEAALRYHLFGLEPRT